MYRSKIEWVLNPDNKTLGWILNPLSGCLNHTPEGLCLGGMFPCYAFRLANGRLKQRYLANLNISYEDLCPNPDLGGLHSLRHSKDPFYPRFWPERLNEDLGICRGIFVCDMSDLFGIGIPEEWTREVLDRIRRSSHRNRYYLLTKQPQNLIKWSPFPENCWVGVTATEQCQFVRAVSELRFIEAPIKYLSFEPLLAHIPMLPEALTLAGINWLIIGACTGTLNDLKPLALKYPELKLMHHGETLWTLQPKIEWVEEIVLAAANAGIPVFFKYNLKPLFKMLFERGEPYSWAADTSGFLKQEMPKEG